MINEINSHLSNEHSIQQTHAQNLPINRNHFQPAQAKPQQPDEDIALLIKRDNEPARVRHFTDASLTAPIHLHVLLDQNIQSAFLTPPVDSWLIILSFLPASALSDLTAVSRSCKRFFTDELMWQEAAKSLGWVQNIPLENISYRMFCLRRQTAQSKAARVWYDVKGLISSIQRASLQSGVSDTGLMRCEQTLECCLPESIRASLREVNGQANSVAPGHGLVDGCRLLSTREVVHQKQVFFSDTAFIPLTDESGARRICINMIDGLIYLVAGRSMTAFHKADDWLEFLHRLARPDVDPEFS